MSVLRKGREGRVVKIGAAFVLGIALALGAIYRSLDHAIRDAFEQAQ